MNLILLAQAASTAANSKQVKPGADPNSTFVVWAAAGLCIAVVIYMLADAWWQRVKRRRIQSWQMVTNEPYVFPPEDAKSSSSPVNPTESRKS